MVSWNTKVKISAVLCILGSMGAWFSLRKKSSLDKESTKSSFSPQSTTDDPEMDRPRIYLRHDQTSQKYKSVPNPGVTIFAPNWVEEALKRLEPQLLGKSFEVRGSGDRILDVLTLKNHLSLADLHKIARNEPQNVSGRIRLEYYHPSVPTDVILTLKDLIRQCAVVGVDRTIAYGGYRSENVEQSSKVYVCDLIGLQFQMPENSGRLVLVAPEGAPFPQGPLDDFIFQQVVGEKKSSYRKVEADSSGRYVPFNYRRHGKIYFDTHAYKKFVANDLILCGIALETIADQQEAVKEEGAKSPKVESVVSNTEPDKQQKLLSLDAESSETSKRPRMSDIKPNLPEEQHEQDKPPCKLPEQVKFTETAQELGNIEGSDVSREEQMMSSDTVFSESHTTTEPTCHSDVPKAMESEAPITEDGGITAITTNNNFGGDLLNFKFLKYGTGFFAGQFTEITTDNILPAVIDGLEELFKIHHPRHIKAVEFPFYTPTHADVDRLEKLKAIYGLEYRFSTDDALKDSVVGLVTATTNCADPHAATGNEMGFSSVDAAIATNLESKGNIFCPLLNPDIKSRYVMLHTKSSL